MDIEDDTCGTITIWFKPGELTAYFGDTLNHVRVSKDVRLQFISDVAELSLKPTKVVED